MSPASETGKLPKEQAPTILVCFAVKAEARHFKPEPDPRCKVIVTGIGPHNARRGLENALLSVKPGLVFTCGYAGGLNPELRRGEIVFEADPATVLEPDLEALGAHAGSFYCADRIAVTAADKQRLLKQSRADAVEMESGVIRQMCRERGIPSATIRIISDDAATDLPLDFNALTKADGNISYSRLAKSLLQSPGTVPKLLRFQTELDACSRRLAQLLQQLLERLWNRHAT